MIKCYDHEECEYNAQPDCVLPDGKTCPHGVPRPSATNADRRGGTLMEVEKLIERLNDWDGVDAIYNGEFVEVNSHGVYLLLEEAAAALEQLQAENDRLKEEVQQMRWIPVEERLPMPCENPVLVYDNSGVGMAWYSSTMGWMYRTGLGCVDITHWMPLPAVPREG